MPPCRAIAIAIRDSVTVSIALEISGVRSEMPAGQPGGGVDLAGDHVGLPREEQHVVVRQAQRSELGGDFGVGGHRRGAFRSGVGLASILTARTGAVFRCARSWVRDCGFSARVPGRPSCRDAARVILACRTPWVTRIRARTPVLQTIETNPSSSAGASRTISVRPREATSAQERLEQRGPDPEATPGGCHLDRDLLGVGRARGRPPRRCGRRCAPPDRSPTRRTSRPRSGVDRRLGSSARRPRPGGQRRGAGVLGGGPPLRVRPEQPVEELGQPGRGPPPRPGRRRATAWAGRSGRGWCRVRRSPRPRLHHPRAQRPPARSIPRAC